MHRLVLAAVLATAAAAGAASLMPPAAGHGGGIPWIYIEAEQVWPGQPFHVLVIDMAPFVNVALEAEAGERRVPLGAVETGAQGHGETDLTLPADFPLGFAQLNGLADDGTAVDTVLRVGDVPGSGPIGPIGPPPGGQLPPGAAVAWWSDPSVVTLGALLGGAALLLGWLVIRGRRTAATASRRRR